jgi:adhesin/invasin
MVGAATIESPRNRRGGRIAAVVACGLMLAAACHRPDDYLLDPSNADEVLAVTPSATTLPADGISRVTITAQLDPRTDFDKRNVVFTTTAGTLIAEGKEATSVTVTADTNGRAVVELRSSTAAATAHIDVTVASVSRAVSVEFVRLTREEVFDVATSGTSVAADGFSTIVITVTLKRLGTPQQQQVKFETSAGTLIASGQPNARAVTITVGEAGVVVVELQSDTAGIANVRVSALDRVYQFPITFTALAREDVFDVSVSRTSIPADGFSTSMVTATLKRSGTPLQRMVKFETSAGMLIAPGLVAARSVTIAADATGRAVAELQSDKSVGSARVRVTAFDLPYELTISFTAVDPANIITLSASSSSAPADGVTAVAVSANIAASVPAGRRTVAFRTTLGLITPIAIEADGSNVARATVTSTVAGTARITATVDGSTAEATVQFGSALPDRVFVAPDVSELKSGLSSNVRVTLARATGSVSPRLEVTYSARTNTGAAIGSFSRITPAESSVSTATFNVGTTAYVGPVTIIATVEGGATGSATLQIVP